MVRFAEDGGSSTGSELVASDLEVLTVEGDRAIVKSLPPGNVLVHQGQRWFATSADELELGSTVLGRADVQFIDAGTTRLTITTPGFIWGPAYHALDLYSVGANFLAPLDIVSGGEHC